ncbi:hypothetical protein DSO57_1028981 [Entomophthora muscae]|uniref:Uncharacterized protein n=1 Tax=Entomophthora muscae TaxID=34485 RepID=A0ACC2SE76_9FUNG|nr:hypothetical protein DSO57_1028981 [Entomophthora muscae]
MVQPVYWLASEPFSEPFGDLLGVLIPQEGVIEDVATSPPRVLEGRALGIFLRVLGMCACLALGTGSLIRIVNSSSLETRTREQESNPNPGPPWTAGPVDCRTARPHFWESTPHKLIPRMLAHAMKQAKPRKLLHQMED